MPTAKPNSAANQSAQVDKFRDLPRELECDDDEAAFAEKVKKLAAVKPKRELKQATGTVIARPAKGKGVTVVVRKSRELNLRAISMALAERPTPTSPGLQKA